ncbi:MAG: IS3 family transposase, partial [Deltaproteobacteria bacterium]
RSALNYKPVEESAEDTRIMRILDEIYTMDPSVGSRRLPTVLERDHGIKANRKRIQRLRRKMGIETIWCRPRRTSLPDNGHRKYPYLLRDRVVEYADEVWCADITYLPMAHGHAYLCAVMDWHSRKVLGWAVSNTMDAALTEKAVAAAVAQCRSLPEIFNTDQGSQFTSPGWTGRLEGLGIKVSMDGKGRWMDNVFIERLWRSYKYEDLYLKEYATLVELEVGIRQWMERYNTWRPHQNLGNQTPARVYETNRKPATPAIEMKEAA